jgi:hypothetical protein
VKHELIFGSVLAVAFGVSLALGSPLAMVLLIGLLAYGLIVTRART